MKAKKAALVYNWTLTLMVIGILAWTLIQFSSKYNKFEPLGTKQLTIFKTYSKAESALFYIDQSAKYSLQQAVYDLGKDGGLSEVHAIETLVPKEEPYLPSSPIKKCNKFYGYSMWYEDGIYCFDENKLTLNLEFLFNKNLNGYLIKHPSNVLLDNYKYEIRDKLEIIGRAKEPLRFDILKDERKEVVKRPIEEKIITKEGIADFQGFTGTEFCAKGTKCLLTKEAYHKFEEAQKLAKEKGKIIEVYSAYRSEEEQSAIWNGETPERYRQRFPIEEERRKYVCNPHLGIEECPHMTGKVIDSRFKDTQMTIEDWRELEKIMNKVGFKRYVRELWHFECCGTARYNRAIALEKQTGKEVTAIA